jgi:hypothetical protein
VIPIETGLGGLLVLIQLPDRLLSYLLIYHFNSEMKVQERKALSVSRFKALSFEF